MRRACRLLTALVLAAAPVVAGCAEVEVRPDPPPGAEPVVVEPVRDEPWRGVRIVGKVPSPARYTLVGRVDGAASRGEFIDAVRAARIDLRRRAQSLGATLVKIDVARPPAESPRLTRRWVLFTGRAYAPNY